MSMRVIIDKGRNLPAPPSGQLLCIVQLGSSDESHTTQAVPSSNTPKWAQTFDLEPQGENDLVGLDSSLFCLHPSILTETHFFEICSLSVTTLLWATNYFRRTGTAQKTSLQSTTLNANHLCPLLVAADHGPVCEGEKRNGTQDIAAEHNTAYMPFMLSARCRLPSSCTRKQVMAQRKALATLRYLYHVCRQQERRSVASHRSVLLCIVLVPVSHMQIL